MFMRSRNWLTGTIGVAVLSFSPAIADDYSIGYSRTGGDTVAGLLAPSPTGAYTGTITGTRPRGAFAGLQQFIDQHPTGHRTIVGIGGALGVVVDHSSGLPRLRGLALSPSEAVTLEASGRVSDGFNDVRGQLSLHLSF